MTINIIFDEDIELYTVVVNGITLFECLSEDEVERLNIRTIGKAFAECM